MSVMYGELRRNQEMDSSIGHSQQHFHQSYLPSTSSEFDTMFKSIPSNNGWNNSETLQEFGGKAVKQEAGESVGPIQHNGHSYGESELINQRLLNGSSTAAGNGFYGSFGVVNTMASKNSTESKMGVRNSSNLIRQHSSPAGFFSNENGVATLREVDSFKASDVSNGQVTAPTRGLNSNLTFSSRPPSCLKWMPQIAEKGKKSLQENCDQNRHLINGNGSSKSYMPSFTNEFWDNSVFSSTKTESEDEIMFSTTNDLESQEADFGYQNLGLTHHLSLPSSSTKLTSIEKFLQIQGCVPCKIRAKRGFATHPRSIAERVRRTRISDRIKKLEGLFPKSDKQTSTADMLDSVVEHIKDLQEQVQILAGRREKCKCT